MVEKYTITKKEEVYNLLKEKRNFSLMDKSLLQRLINEMKIVRFTKKTLLIKQNEENRFIYIIVKGGATIYVDNKPLYMLRRTGDVFGELSFISKSPSTASVVAEPDTGVMAISFKYLKKMNDMEFALWLARVIGDKLIRTSKLKTGGGDEQVDSKDDQTKKPPASATAAEKLEKSQKEEVKAEMESGEAAVLDGQKDTTVEETSENAEDSGEVSEEPEPQEQSEESGEKAREEEADASE